MLLIEFETKLPGIEVDGTLHVLHLISDTPKTFNETLILLYVRVSVVRRIGRSLLGQFLLTHKFWFPSWLPNRLLAWLSFLRRRFLFLRHLSPFFARL